MHCSLDYETRSTCDLKVSGAYVYARDSTTTVLCAAYQIDDGPIRIWARMRDDNVPADLQAAFDNPECELHAWNSQFERLITRHVLGLHIPIHRWRCTAAWARSRGLPGGLEDALALLKKTDKLSLKRAGSQIMLRWASPLNAETDPAYPLWADDPREYDNLLQYCGGDVDSESFIQHALRAVPMTDVEWQDFFVNEAINDRGLPIDVPLALAAAIYGAEEKVELNRLLAEKTFGMITSASQHARVKTMLRDTLPPWMFDKYFVTVEAGVRTVSTDKRAREEFMLTAPSAADTEDDLDDDDVSWAEESAAEACDILEILSDAGKSSVGKFAKMAAYATVDGRAQGAYMYAGAGQTKRYSSRGIQMHNLPRASPKPEDLPRVIQGVLKGTLVPLGTDPTKIKVMHVLASLLRPTIKAPDGRKLVWGDWSSVEARAMPWLAGAKAKLDLYREGKDVYRVNAQDIFGTPYDEVPDDERQIGKVSELSLQFGGALGALKAMARGYGIALDVPRARLIVDKWRAANAWAPRFSYGLMRAFATCALRTAGKVYPSGKVAYRPLTRFGLGDRLTIECVLPDGTVLYYPGLSGGDTWVDGFRTDDDGVVHPVYRWTYMPKRLEVVVPPDMQESTTHYNPKGKVELTYMKMLAGGSVSTRIWHGLLAENVTQALCASLLRDCLERVEYELADRKLDAFVVGHTHDEIILEAHDRDAVQAAKVLEREMLRVPEWLPGFPLGCEVKSGQRYVK